MMRLQRHCSGRRPGYNRVSLIFMGFLGSVTPVTYGQGGQMFSHFLSVGSSLRISRSVYSTRVQPERSLDDRFLPVPDEPSSYTSSSLISQPSTSHRFADDASSRVSKGRALREDGLTSTKGSSRLHSPACRPISQSPYAPCRPSSRSPSPVRALARWRE